MGIPMFILGVLYLFRIPAMARRKTDDAVVAELLHKFKKTMSTSLAAKMAEYVGSAGVQHGTEGDQRVLLARAKAMFNGATKNSGGKISSAALVR
jgi:hypothetical protein